MGASSSTVALSPRLSALFAARSGAPVTCDLCCDHGSIGLRALVEDDAHRAVFVDRSPAVRERLQQRLTAWGVADRAEVIIADARTLGSAAGPTDVLIADVFIAGVGGRLAASLVETFVARRCAATTRVILQPQSQAARAHAALMERAHRIDTRTFVDRRGRVATFFVADMA